MRLVTSVSFSVQLNGNCLEPFTHLEELDKSDSISPYLFLLAARAFRASWNQEISHQSSIGIKVALSVPSILIKEEPNKYDYIFLVW